MLTIITNHYLPEITPINLCIIYFKNLYLYNVYTIFTLKSQFSQYDNYKLGESTQRKVLQRMF